MCGILSDAGCVSGLAPHTREFSSELGVAHTTAALLLMTAAPLETRIQSDLGVAELWGDELLGPVHVGRDAELLTKGKEDRIPVDFPPVNGR